MAKPLIYSHNNSYISLIFLKCVRAESLVTKVDIIDLQPLPASGHENDRGSATEDNKSRLKKY